MINQSETAAGLTAAIASVNAAISAVGTLQDSSPIVLQTVYISVLNNRAEFDAAISAIDADIDITSVGSVLAGVPGPISAALLLNQEWDVSHQADVIIAEAYLVRVGANIAGTIGTPFLGILAQPTKPVIPSPPVIPPTPQPTTFTLDVSILDGSDVLA